MFNSYTYINYFYYNTATLFNLFLYSDDIIKPTIIIGFIVFIFAVVLQTKTTFNSIIKIHAIFWAILSTISFVCVLKNFITPNNLQNFAFKNSLFSIHINLFFFKECVFLFTIDNINIFFIFTVAIITYFALQHAYVYMQEDQKKEKFILFLNGFAFSMIGLVISKNLIFIFFFWELLGVTSFFLINHNDTQLQSQKSAYKAFLYNKNSDFLFLISLIILYNVLPNFNIVQENLNYMSNIKQHTTTSIISLKLALFLLFLAAIIKSVQVFTCFWLPDSMKAPAPASALIHSATLVAAGFYIIILIKPILVNYFGVGFLTYIGILGAVFGAMTGLYQFDVKKILAYSTIANCGFMLVLLASYDVNVFLMYFVAHGLFKSLCFMLAGNIIISQHHEQDTRLFKNNTQRHLKTIKNLTILIFFLAGAPFSTIYLVKHSVNIENFSNNTWAFTNAFMWFYGFLSIMYALSFLFKSFFGLVIYKQNFNINSVEYNTKSTQDLVYSFISVIVCLFYYYYFKFLNGYLVYVVNFEYTGLFKKLEFIVFIIGIIFILKLSNELGIINIDFNGIINFVIFLMVLYVVITIDSFFTQCTCVNNDIALIIKILIFIISLPAYIYVFTKYVFVFIKTCIKMLMNKFLLWY